MVVNQCYTSKMMHTIIDNWHKIRTRLIGLFICKWLHANIDQLQITGAHVVHVCFKLWKSPVELHSKLCHTFVDFTLSGGGKGYARLFQIKSYLITMKGWEVCMTLEKNIPRIFEHQNKASTWNKDQHTFHKWYIIKT